MAFDYQLEDTVFLPFTTRAFATGIPTVLAGTPAIDIYEDATATPIITGETLVVSLNSVVGFNMITVTATAATGFNADGHYTAVIQAGTVGGVSVVGEVVGEFTIEAAPVNWAKVAAPSTAVDLSATDIQLVDTTTVNTDMRGTDSALLAASISLTGGAVDNVTLVDTTITNIDMRGTDGANTTTPPTTAAIATAVLTTQMTEIYAVNGVAPTLAQAQFAMHQMLMQFGIAGTSLTVRKLDDSTTAFIVTLDDAVNPTDAKRV